jgi:hypothetical protein
MGAPYKYYCNTYFQKSVIKFFHDLAVSLKIIIYNECLQELPDPLVSTDTIEDVVIPFVDNNLRSLQSRVDEALSSMNPPVVLNPVADQKTLRANPVSLRCHLVQRRLRGQQRLRQQQQLLQQQQLQQ